MIDQLNKWLIENYLYKIGKRYPSISIALNLFVERGGKNIVETGTTRILGNYEGDGCTTILWGAVAKYLGGRAWTVDINDESIQLCRFATKEFGDSIEYTVGDSVGFLKIFPKTIDLLYLDSLDFIVGGDPNPAQDHCVNEYLAAKDKLSPKVIIVIDDCGLPEGGKGKKLAEMLLAEGYTEVFSGYQRVFTKND